MLCQTPSVVQLFLSLLCSHMQKVFSAFTLHSMGGVDDECWKKKGRKTKLMMMLGSIKMNRHALLTLRGEKCIFFILHTFSAFSCGNSAVWWLDTLVRTETAKRIGKATSCWHLVEEPDRQTPRREKEAYLRSFWGVR